MAISLQSLRSGTNDLPPRVIVYGVEGIGKTTLGLQAPNCIVIKTEEGQGQLEATRFQFDPTGRDVAQNLQEVKDAIRALCEEKHSYNTLFIDSLTSVEALIHAELCDKHGEPDIIGNQKGSRFSFEGGIKLAAKSLSELLEYLSFLRESRRMMIILSAHASVIKFKSPDTEDWDRYDLELEKKYSLPLVKKWADAVLFCRYEKPLLAQEEVGFNKTKSKAKSDREAGRIILTEERATHSAKNRYGMPYEIEFSKLETWKAFEPYLLTWLPKESEKKKKAA